MDSLWAEIEQLRQAPIGQLRSRYRELFQEEPRSKHREQLFRRLAWRLQAASQGGLSERAQRRADEIADEADLRVVPPSEFLSSGAAALAAAGRTRARFDRRIPPPGTVLRRQYRGDAIVVTVLADGFEYGGRHYRSLSAIATEVTGTRWNGIAFFRLTTKRLRARRKGRHV